MDHRWLIGGRGGRRGGWFIGASGRDSMGEAARGSGRVDGLPHPVGVRLRNMARGRTDAFTKPSIVRARRSHLWAGVPWPA